MNKQAKKIPEKLNIDDRIEKIHESKPYIMVKDDKKGFPNNPSFRLINLSKSDIGRISKKILDKINQRVIQETKVNQWKNTNTVIAWLKSLPDKSCLSFVNFDIESFYPSISLIIPASNRLCSRKKSYKGHRYFNYYASWKNAFKSRWYFMD